MPKKVGENSKAVAAKARKEEKASAEKAKKEKEAEDKLWADDDKQLAKKQARKEDAERKRIEALEKKKERDALLAEEAEKEKGKTSTKKAPPAPKITRAQIQEEVLKQQQTSAKKPPSEPEIDIPLENVNRLEIEGVSATTIDEAISVLSISGNAGEAVDKHPEKRMKAAYEEFEKVRLPELKEEYPTFRLSQLKQLLRKEWLKHPNNPLNKKLAAMAK